MKYLTHIFIAGLMTLVVGCSASTESVASTDEVSVVKEVAEIVNTATPLPPTATSTPLPPTATSTPLPPTVTPIPEPTATQSPVATSTPDINATAEAKIEKEVVQVEVLESVDKETNQETSQEPKIEPRIIRAEGNTYANNALDFMDVSDYDKAIGQFTLALDKYESASNLESAIVPDSSFIEAYYYRGLSYLYRFAFADRIDKDIEDVRRGVEDFSKLLNIDPEDPDFYYQRGVLLLLGLEHSNIMNIDYIKLESDGTTVTDGNYVVAYGQAAKDFDKAILYQYDPLENAYYFRGASYLDGHLDYEQAIADFDMALYINPKGEYSDAAIYDRSRAVELWEIIEPFVTIPTPIIN